MNCPMCEGEDTKGYAVDEKRQWSYWHCGDCDLVYRDPQSYLSLLQEKARYQTHNNSIENAGYVKFLTPVVQTTLPFIEKSQRGLDYGCGPGPILDILFEREGVSMDNYDPIFFSDRDKVSKNYDFVTCTEVIEHFYNPGQEFKKLKELVKVKGILVLMTDTRPSQDKFLSWGYRMDNTHVCFYSDKVFNWIADSYGFDLLKRDDRLTVLRKNS